MLLIVEIILVSLIFPNINADNLETSEFYGYVINIYPDQSYALQRNISCLINELLNNEIRVYWICSNISILSENTNEIKIK